MRNLPTTIAAAVEFFSKGFPPGSELKFKTDEVNGDGEWAFDRGTFKLTQEGNELDAGKLVSDSAEYSVHLVMLMSFPRYILVWRKVGPDFFIHNDIWNPLK